MKGKLVFSILALPLLLFSCNQNRNTNVDDKQNVPLSDSNTTNKKQPVQEKLSFKNIVEVANNRTATSWVKMEGDNISLAIHFLEEDKLYFSYSAECWLLYPYKIEGNKIIGYWAENIDSKYNFDIVKAVTKIDKKYIGKPFIILELKNDTTLSATYPYPDLIRKLNSSSNERTYFPEKFYSHKLHL